MLSCRRDLLISTLLASTKRKSIARTTLQHSEALLYLNWLRELAFSAFRAARLLCSPRQACMLTTVLFFAAGCLRAASAQAPGDDHKPAGGKKVVVSQVAGGSTQSTGESKRIVLNLDNLTDNSEYKFIDIFQEGQNSAGPFSSSWSTGTVWSSAILDVHGYPCWVRSANPTCSNTSGISNPANDKPWGGGFSIPASVNYSGVYCLQGKGSGAIQLGGSGIWTEQSGNPCGSFSGTYKKVSNGHWVVTDETDGGWVVPIVYSGPLLFAQAWIVTSDDPDNSGHYIQDLAFYRLSDQTDFKSGCPALTPTGGCIFRRAYKQQIVDLDPFGLRCMNWCGGNSTPEMRFEDRPLPGNQVGYSGAYNPVVGLVPYQTADTTLCDSAQVNQYCVSAAQGMPSSTTHGERVWIRAEQSSTNPALSVTVTAITVPFIGIVQVSTASPHNFSVGDTIQLTIAGGRSTDALNFYPAVVTAVPDFTHYQFSFSGSVPTCTGVSACNAVAGEYYSLDVGNRGAYPITIYSGNAPYSLYFGITSGHYYEFCFNKNLFAETDGMGSRKFGVWIPCDGNSGGSGPRTVPIEITVDLVNELNAMIPTSPINLLYITPAMSVVCNNLYCDPDGNSSSEWAANAVNVILNGANGFAGLKHPAQLFDQFGCNECWNTAFAQSQQMAWRGYIRWANANDFDSFSELLSLWQAYDVKNSSYFNSDVVHFFDSGQASTGAAVAGYNYDRITGSNLKSTSDSANPIGSAAPITYYDAGFAVAPYFSTGTANLTNMIGTATNPGSLVMGWINAVQASGYDSPQAQADVASWVGLMTNDPTGDSTSVLETDISALSTLTSSGTINNGGLPYKKSVFNYEGGWNVAWKAPLFISNISCASGQTLVTTSTANTYALNQKVLIQNTSAGENNTIFTVTQTGNPFAINAGTCSAPSTSYQGYYGNVNDVVSAFLIAADSSLAWAQAQTNFCSYFSSNPNVYGCGVYVQTGGEWSFAYPDSYGSGKTEGGGYFPSWSHLMAFDQNLTN
jgi:hypothetical protein